MRSTSRSTTPTPRTHRPAFSLVEMVVSLAVISILLVGMTSAIVLASRALPANQTPAAATVESGRALHQLRNDLRAATELLNRTATSVTLNLPDRDGDGRPEVIAYAWSGTPGDPLTRTVNGTYTDTLLEDVESFDLQYTTTDLATVFPGSENWSSEQLLSSFETPSTEANWRIKPDEWVGTRVAYTSPDSGAWRISRSLFYGRDAGANTGTLTFEIRPWDTASAAPQATALDSKAVEENALGSTFDWQEVVFDGLVTIAAGDEVGVLIKAEPGEDAGRFKADTADAAPSALFSTTDSGATWTAPAAGDELMHFVYGHYAFPSDDWTFTQPLVTAIELELVHSSSAATTHRVQVPLPNSPEAVDTLWEADFNAAPTALDLANDGQADWLYDGTFDPANLSGGRWEADDAMRSGPDSPTLATPFTVEFWGEDTLENDDTGGVRIRFDRNDAGQHAYVTVEVDRTATGQIVRLLSKDAAGDGVTWHFQTQPAGAPVHVKLSIDPANDTVGVAIDDQVVGSFGYELFNSSNSDGLRPFVDGSSSGFYLDHLRMTTGGTATITPGAY